MRVFDGSKSASEEFKGWMIKHPDGFVINIRGNHLILHLASCGHFKFQETDDVTFAPKRASFNREELDTWARNQIGKRYSICSKLQTVILTGQRAIEDGGRV
jgi:hypothetical protein